MRRWRRVLALADRPLVKGVGEVARGSHEGGHGQGKLRHAHAPLDRSVDASGGVLGPDEKRHALHPLHEIGLHEARSNVGDRDLCALKVEAEAPPRRR